MRPRGRSLPPSERGFTLLELLVAMALFTVLGVAVISLLSQGLNLFREGTADTSMQDRLQSILPLVRADFQAIQPLQPPEVPPPPEPDDTDGSAAPPTPPAPPEPPAVRLLSGWRALSDLPKDWPPAFFVAMVRTNARESEDPLLRRAGSAGSGGGAPLRDYDPAAIESGATGNLFATGGLLEVVWIAVPEDPNPERRTGKPAPDSTWHRGILTLYRLFRAPVGGAKTLLDPKNFDSLEKVRAAGRPMHEGVLHFGVTWRNVFATSWTDGLGSGRVEDGQAYVGPVWDSTRGLEKQFPLFRGPDSAADTRDDVFPAMARIDLTLATEGAFGFGRGDTLLEEPLAADETRAVLESVQPLYRPGPSERFLKVDGEWMVTTLEGVDLAARRVVVVRGRRGTPAVQHQPGEPVYVGASVSTDVPLVYRDRYVPRR